MTADVDQHRQQQQPPVVVDGRSKRHRFIRDRIVDARWFEIFMMLTIVANAVLLWPMTDESKRVGPVDERRVLERTVYFSLRAMFVGIYVVELLLKLYVSPIVHWQSAINWLEFLILGVSISWLLTYHAFGRPVVALSVLQTLRIVSVVRFFQYIHGLKVLLTAFVKVLTEWMPSILVLVAILLYISSVVGQYWFEEADSANWGHLGVAFLSLASMFACAGWTDIEQALENGGYVASARGFTAVVVCVGNFIVSNVIIGVILLNVDRATKKFEKEERRRKEKIMFHKKENMMMRQRHELDQLMEHQRRGSFTNFHEMVNEFRANLKHTDVVVSDDLSTNILWLETYLQTLNKADDALYHVQQLHLEMANNLAKALELKLGKIYTARSATPLRRDDSEDIDDDDENEEER